MPKCITLEIKLSFLRMDTPRNVSAVRYTGEANPRMSLFNLLSVVSTSLSQYPTVDEEVVTYCHEAPDIFVHGRVLGIKPSTI